MRVEQIMTKSVCACAAEQTLDDIARMMWNDDCGCVPVVDGAGVVVGMVTDRDIAMAAFFSGLSLSAMRVGSMMANPIVACRPTDRVTDAEASMIQYQIRRLPVVDAGRRLVGMLSLSDLARAGQLQPDADGDAITASEIEATLAGVSAPRLLRTPVGARESRKAGSCSI